MTRVVVGNAFCYFRDMDRAHKLYPEHRPRDRFIASEIDPAEQVGEPDTEPFFLERSSRPPFDRERDSITRLRNRGSRGKAFTLRSWRKQQALGGAHSRKAVVRKSALRLSVKDMLGRTVSPAST